MPEPAEHDLAAIGQYPSWLRLQYLSESEQLSHGNRPRWYTKVAYRQICRFPIPAGKNCDEYPYISSEQGGEKPPAGTPTPSLKELNGSQNVLEGRLLGQFYKACGINAAPRGDAKRTYLVVPLPPEAGIYTTGWCRRTSA